MAKATVNLGDEIEVHLKADEVRDHYGVPGSPVWTSYENDEIESLEILGIDVTQKDISKSLWNHIWEMAADEADQGKLWESE